MVTTDDQPGIDISPDASLDTRSYPSPDAVHPSEDPPVLRLIAALLMLYLGYLLFKQLIILVSPLLVLIAMLFLIGRLL